MGVAFAVNPHRRRGGVLGDGVRHAAALTALGRPQALLRSCVCSSVRMVPATRYSTREPGEAVGQEDVQRPVDLAAAGERLGRLDAADEDRRGRAPAAAPAGRRNARRRALRGRRWRRRQAPVPQREHGQAEHRAQVLQHVAHACRCRDRWSPARSAARRGAPSSHCSCVNESHSRWRPHAEQDRQRREQPFHAGVRTARSAARHSPRARGVSSAVSGRRSTTHGRQHQRNRAPGRCVKEPAMLWVSGCQVHAALPGT